MVRPWTISQLSRRLCWLSFFTTGSERPGAFLASYLLLKGWSARHIGAALFTRDIISLLVQIPMGDYMDKSKKKREAIVLADLILAICSAVIIASTNYATVVIIMLVQGIALTVSLSMYYHTVIIIYYYYYTLFFVAIIIHFQIIYLLP